VRVIEETASPTEFGIYKFFAESISIGLSRPSKIDVITLVNMSLSNKDKTLLEMLTESEATQKE
jgi:hypothetical protein